MDLYVKSNEAIKIDNLPIGIYLVEFISNEQTTITQLIKI